MAVHRSEPPPPALRIAAYEVLRHAHPELPKLSLEGHGRDRSLGRCFAAARKLLGGPDSAGLFDEPWASESPGGSSPDRLRRVAADIRHRLAADPWADPLASMFEATAATRDRRAQGQHFTPPGVVDLVLALARMGPGDQVLDPTCGSGTFLLRAQRRRESLPHGAPGLWGCEKDPLAAALARINLCRGSGVAAGRVRTGDVFDLVPGVDVGGLPLPHCAAVVGNLPYVRLHRRGDGGAWGQRLAVLARQWAAVDPALVTLGPAGEPTLKLSGHADLYAALLLHLVHLVQPGGRMALLTSNAYLDAGYGGLLRQLFVRHFRVIAVVESRCEPWFADASVNTVITVLERCPDARTRARHRARFVKLTRPIGALPNAQDGGAQDGGGSARIARDIETARPDRGAESPAPECTHTAACRIRFVPQRQLEAPDAGDAPWSPYLRAPDVYFALRDHPGFRPAGELLRIRRGVTTNWNPFFYPDEHAGIERSHLVTVVRSPRVSRTIEVQADRVTDRLFVCHASEEALREAGQHGALAWIAQGRKLTNRHGRPISESLSRRPWYRLEPHRHRILFTKAIHDTHLHRLVDRPVAVDQRLYGVTPRKSLDDALVAATLNCSAVALMAEVVGSASLGEGALDLPVTTVQRRLLIPDLEQLGARHRQRLLGAFAPLARRQILPVTREVLQPDRRALDEALCRALGLDPARTMPALYQGLCELAQERLQLAAQRRALGSARKPLDG
ncbi:MAG: N-6 DNA methylase [bacterium]